MFSHSLKPNSEKVKIVTFSRNSYYKSGGMLKLLVFFICLEEQNLHHIFVLKHLQLILIFIQTTERKPMETVQKKYIVDENNKPVAVQVDIETFEKIEEIMENHGLYELMKQTEDEAEMDLTAAKRFYSKLEKTP